MKYLILLLVSANLSAAPIGDLKLTADVVKENSDVVIIKNEQGELSLPRTAVKNKEIKKGKAVELYVDPASYEQARADLILKQNEVKK